MDRMPPFLSFVVGLVRPARGVCDLMAGDGAAVPGAGAVAFYSRFGAH